MFFGGKVHSPSAGASGGPLQVVYSLDFAAQNRSSRAGGMGALAPMVTAVSQRSKSAPKTDAGRGFQNRPGRFSRLPNRAVFLALRTHARTRSRTLLTIGRYWLFKRRIAYAAGEPLELLRNPSGGVMPAALLRLNSLLRCKYRAGRSRTTGGSSPPIRRIERGHIWLSRRSRLQP